MLRTFRCKFSAGLAVASLTGSTAVAGLLGRIPGSGLQFLLVGRAPCLAFAPTISFLAWACVLFLMAMGKARRLCLFVSGSLLLGALAYPFAYSSGLAERVESSLRQALFLSALAVDPPMPVVTGFAIGVIGLMGVLADLKPPLRTRRPWSFYTIAVSGSLLVTFGALSLLYTSLDLPLNSNWNWAQSFSRVSPEAACLFVLVGAYGARSAVQRLPFRDGQRSFVAGILAAGSMLALFLCVNVTLSVALQGTALARQEIREAHQSQTALEQITALVREAESGQRGYLLTGDEQYLDAYLHGVREAKMLVAKPLALGNSWVEIAAFRRAVAEKLDELQMTLAMERSGKPENARSLVRSGRGRELMVEVLALRRAINARMDSEIERRNTTYRQSADVISRTVFTSYGIAAALLFCAIFLFRGEIRRRSAVETKLRANETELETRIALPTADLAASERRYRALLDQSPVAIHVFSANGETVSVNSSFERMFQTPAAQMVGFNFLTHPASTGRPHHLVLKRAFDGEVVLTSPFQFEDPRLAAQGFSPWLEAMAYPVKDAEGSVVEIVFLISDVTGRESALRAMRESETQFRQLADSLPQMIWTADPDLKPIYLNSRWYEVTGWPKGVAGLDFFQLVHPDDRNACAKAWRLSVAEEREFELDYRLFDASRQEYRWYLARAVPMHDETGKLHQWFGICMEIHEQKEAEAVLEQRVGLRTAELERSNQLLRASEEALREALRERETLFKEVHHRVKNNLQVISSLLRMKAQALTDQPAAATALEESRRRVQSMAFIHESLYSYGSMDQIDFASYTRTLVRELVFSYNTPEHTVDFHIDAQPVELNVEQAIPCGLILNELVTNALKYAFRGRASGLIEVTLSMSGGNEVTLHIADNGVGLPPDLIPERLDSLGLPIVDILTRQIGGRLEIGRAGAPPARSGASFTIRFGRIAPANRAA